MKTVKKIDYTKCQSCGQDFADHLGIIGTCAEVQRLRGIIRRAQAAFCGDGSDGAVAAKMFTTLAEADA